MFQAAAGSVVITPVPPGFPSTWMGGYGWAPRFNNGTIARNLRAHCVVIWDDGTPNVLVRADVVGMQRNLVQAIRTAVAALGVAPADFLIASSHTHSGPQMSDTRIDPFILMGLTQADKDAINGTVAVIRDAIVQLVRDTLAMPRTDVTLHYSESQAVIGYNRIGRPTVPTDVPVLVLRRVDDSPLAILFGYACHPVARGLDNVFDSDYPGFAAELLEAVFGCPALFFQGCCGDIDPVDHLDDERVREHGRTVAVAVLNRILDPASFTEVTGPVGSRLTEVQLPFSVVTANATVRSQLRAKYQARITALPAGDPARRHASVMVGLIDANALPTSVPMSLQCWKLGGLTILGLAHEVLSSYPVKIKEAFTGDHLWVMGYVNECEAYVPGDEVLWAGGAVHGGYEAGWTDDNTVSGPFTSSQIYAWPAPLKASPVGSATPTSTSAEGIILNACRTLIA
ncbi:hypothetical protein ACFXGA_20290 [Actinosynnema sp. NPDC059335]|uniref:hypothetical protein n=1 Tax=Actinosynnema sp. NPDC059335 TaxID=3346804 RepID=UPI003670511A